MTNRQPASLIAVTALALALAACGATQTTATATPAPSGPATPPPPSPVDTTATLTSNCVMGYESPTTDTYGYPQSDYANFQAGPRGRQHHRRDLLGARPRLPAHPHQHLRQHRRRNRIRRRLLRRQRRRSRLRPAERNRLHHTRAVPHLDRARQRDHRRRRGQRHRPEHPSRRGHMPTRPVVPAVDHSPEAPRSFSSSAFSYALLNSSPNDVSPACSTSLSSSHPSTDSIRGITQLSRRASPRTPS